MKKKFTLFFVLAIACLSLQSTAQNNAVILDGTTSAVTTSAAIVPSTGDFTVEFWGLIPALGTGAHEFVSQGGTAGSNFYIGYDATSGNIQAGDKWASTGVAMPVGTWTHFALVNSGGTATLYVNGASMGSQTGYSITSGTANFAIGEQYNGTGFINGTIDQLRIWNIARSTSDIKTGLYGVVDPATPGLVAYYQMNEGTGTTLANSTATTGLDGTLTGAATWTSSPIQSSPNGLNFDGSGSKVIVPTSPVLDALSSATIEMRVNPGNIAANGDMIGLRNQFGTKFSFLLSNFYIAMAAGSNYNTITFSPVQGTWYHFAFVVDGVADTTGVFVDGAYLGKFTFALGTATGLPLVMGVSSNFPSDADPFAGSLDEVRIWNTMRTQTQINSFMGNTLTGTETGLVALYSFDQGNPGGNNSFLTTAIDNSPNNLHGVLNGFALTGTSSNFILDNAISLPVNFTSFTVVPVKGDQALLQWQTAQEQNSRDFTIERSADGSGFSPIGSVAAAGNSSSARNYDFTDASPLKGANYYRLKETDLDNKSMYSIIRTINFGDNSNKGLIWFKTGDRSVQVQLKQGNNELYIVTDIAGRTIRKGQLSSGKLDLTTPTTGLYAVKVFMPSGTVMNTKVLVQ
jgi:hypothetical protein